MAKVLTKYQLGLLKKMEDRPDIKWLSFGSAAYYDKSGARVPFDMLPEDCRMNGVHRGSDEWASKHGHPAPACSYDEFGIDPVRLAAEPKTLEEHKQRLADLRAKRAKAEGKTFEQIVEEETGPTRERERRFNELARKHGWET